MSDQSEGPGWWVASDGKWYPPQAAPPPPSAAQQQVAIPAKERVEWASFAGAIALVIGSFMTWAQAGPFRVSGTDGDGWLTIILGGFAAVTSWRAKYLKAAVAASLGLAIVIWKLADIAELADDEASFITVSPGAGLYICGLGAGISAAASIACWRRRHRDA